MSRGLFVWAQRAGFLGEHEEYSHAEPGGASPREHLLSPKEKSRVAPRVLDALPITTPGKFTLSGCNIFRYGIFLFRHMASSGLVATVAGIFRVAL